MVKGFGPGGRDAATVESVVAIFQLATGIMADSVFGSPGADTGRAIFIVCAGCFCSPEGGPLALGRLGDSNFAAGTFLVCCADDFVSFNFRWSAGGLVKVVWVVSLVAEALVSAESALICGDGLRTFNVPSSEGGFSIGVGAPSSGTGVDNFATGGLLRLLNSVGEAT